MSIVSGRVVVVTGASSGIGEQATRDMAEAGATMCLAARREDRLAKIVESLPGKGHSFVATDVSDRDQVRSLAEHVRATYGRCDVLVNNAGFSRGGAFRGADSVADIEAMMRTNFLGAVYCTGELFSLLESSAPSHIVNIASVAGRVGLTGGAGYSASKFALVGWSEGIRAELEGRGVYVSLIEPGPIPTEGFPQSYLTKSPILRRAVGSQSDVSDAILDAIEHRKMQRVVPRFYYLAQFPRLLAPPLYRAALRRILSRRR